MPTRRACLGCLAGAAALILGVPAARAERLPLDALSGYLGALETVEGAFTQINPDGSLSTGTLYIKRPGRIRFEYDPPMEALVIAGGGQLAVFDPVSNQGVDRYPLAQTPLKILLDRNVDLAQSGMVTGLLHDGATTTLRVQDPANPDIGALDLVFTADPVRLRQWIVTDATGAQTTVVFGDVTEGGRVPERLFNIRAEMRSRGLEES